MRGTCFAPPCETGFLSQRNPASKAAGMSRFSNVLLAMSACNLNKRMFDRQEPMLPRRCVNGIKRLPNGRVGDDGYRAIKVAYVQQISHSHLSDAMSVLGQPGSAYNDCNWAQSCHCAFVWKTEHRHPEWRDCLESAMDWRLITLLSTKPNRLRGVR